jgi:HAMP domain-containing protein
VFKNVSIRAKIIVGVLLVNLIGAGIVIVYLHQTFSSGLHVAAQDNVTVSSNAWNDILASSGKKIDAAVLAKDGSAFAERAQKITGSDYGILLAKEGVDPAVIKGKEELDGDYVLVGSTPDANTDVMKMANTTPDMVDEAGKVVGVQNGACAGTCHSAIKEPGDFWRVDFSTDGKSRAHAVFPINDSTGKPIALVYSVTDVSTQANADNTSLIRTAGMIAATAIISTIVIALMLNFLVFNRLNRMITSMEDLSMRVAGGDFDAHFQPDGSNDEIGHFENFFARFLDLMTGTLKAVTKK